MRILYLPIFEGGSVHETAVNCKRGLYTALAKAGHQVTEFDYLDAGSRTYDYLFKLLEIYEPNLLLTQFHGADRLPPDELETLRKLFYPMYVVNWSGDSWLHSLTAQPMIDLLRHVDLQLVAAPDVLPEYERLGIRAAYWNIAYEPPVTPLPDMPAYDVVFLGNVINDKRRAMLEMLRTLPYSVGIYGDWEHADGRNVYNFAAGEALYKNARLAIADNVYQDQMNYISNRPMQIMAAGGALCLHQHVDKMVELAGWQHGVHYIEWQDISDLERIIRDLMHGRRLTLTEPHDIILRAQDQVLQIHTYDRRVLQLFEMIEGIPA